MDLKYHYIKLIISNENNRLENDFVTQDKLKS
jgi:hypothetical protein